MPGVANVPSFTVQLVSPEKVLYEGEASFVAARTLGGGDIGFEPGHAPFLAALQTWPIRVIGTDNIERKFACHGGFIQVDAEKVVILSDIAEVASDIDPVRAAEAKQRAEAALVEDVNDAEAAAALARAIVRIDIAG